MEEKQTNCPYKEHELFQAIFIVNKHAKAAPMPKLLYKLKRQALQKLIEEGKALKLGLHYSDNPKNAQQQSDVIIQCGDYVFHLPPSKEDIKCLPHLGKRSLNKRNPKTHMSLTRAKAILNTYIGPIEEDQRKMLVNEQRNKIYRHLSAHTFSRIEKMKLVYSHLHFSAKRCTSSAMLKTT